MEDWAGFTDADLKKLKHQGSRGDGISPRLQARKPGPSSLVVQKRPTSGQKRPPGRNIAPSENVLPPEQRLSQPKPVERRDEKDKSAKAGSPPPNSQTDTGQANSTSSTDAGSHHHSKDDSADKTLDKPEEAKPEKEDSSLIIDDQEIFKHEASTMESFQKQQKMIEEQNKKKRQMLQSKIKERAKAAKAESTKLTEISKELGKLDQLLTIDVSIIRDKIETASREYFDAQKRYDRAEKEYVASKIDLHQKMEAKEQLTEHLYTVIYQNEMRKAKKLADLMVKLEMEAAEVSEIPECEMPHPSLISPVQLPAGRYGQIGLVNLKTPPTSPETAGDSAEHPLEASGTAGEGQGKGERKDGGTSGVETEKSEDTSSGDKLTEKAEGDKSDMSKCEVETPTEKSTEQKTDSESKTVSTDDSKESEKSPKDINQNPTEISAGGT